MESLIVCRHAESVHGGFTALAERPETKLLAILHGMCEPTFSPRSR